MAKQSKSKVQESAVKPLTIKQATDAHQVITALIENDKANKFVFASSVRCRLALNLRKTKPITEEFMNVNNELVAKYGEKELEVKKVNDVDTPVETGRFIMRADMTNWEKFAEEYKALVNSATDLVLQPIKNYELAGVSEKDYNDPNADPSKQNQVPTELIEVLYEVGLLVE